MHKSILNINSVKNEIKKYQNSEDKDKVEIIAISKTFPIQNIMPLIDYGHIHFGENKVQEALDKWSVIKTQNKAIKLHLVGKLQTNKVKFALPLFDYIHSLDNLKLAEKIDNQQKKTGFRPKIFVQVNIGEEDQKNGLSVNSLEDFLIKCENELDLNIIGLMCIPPNDQNTETYFLEMNKLNKQFGYEELSMGMSDDYHFAIKHNSTFLRIGSKIFGSRVK